MSTGTVFDIHHYAVHDGPGIRTLVFLKGCPLACRWCCNPESQSRQPTLMHSDWRCTACGNCRGACPNGAATMETDGPRFDRKICGQCNTWDCFNACRQEAISRAGAPMEVKAVLDRVAKDIPFYINSGGGATFSGGEPYNQFDFLMELLRGCHTLGIHTAVETSGFAATPDFIASAPLVDMFLFDLKVMDSQRHIELTGVDNRLIIENLTWLAAHVPQKVVVRLALIPGFTDDWDNLEAISVLMDKLGLKEINLEPFNPMGVEKYKSAGKEYKGPIQFDPAYMAQVKAAHDFFLARGLHCEVM